jgi:VWFA-related protein
VGNRSRLFAKPVCANVLCLVALFPQAVLAVQQSASSSQQPDPVQFKSNVNVVLVPVLVRDADGHVIEDLKKDDFQMLDRGKRQSISHFTVQRRPGNGSGPRTARDAASAANTQQALGGTGTTPLIVRPERYIIFLFDDLHLLAGDFSRVRTAASRMMAESLQPTDAAAVVSTSGEINSGFTRNRTKLEDAVAKLHLQTLYANEHDCPDITPYEANLILNLGDSDTLREVTALVKSCLGPTVTRPDEMARAAAEKELERLDQGTHATLTLMRSVVRSIGAAPGQRTLVLISRGFLVSSSRFVRAELSRLMDAAAQANVMISSLDARGLYTDMLDSSERGRLPSDVDSTGSMMRLKEQNRRDSMSAAGAVMDELASSTGGTCFHNSNDLEGGFQSVTKAPECVYLLEFSPEEAQPDGSFHRLSVKVNRKGARVRARQGYFAEKPADVKK